MDWLLVMIIIIIITWAIVEMVMKATKYVYSPSPPTSLPKVAPPPPGPFPKKNPPAPVLCKFCGRPNSYGTEECKRCGAPLC